MSGGVAATLDAVSFAKLPGDRVQIKLELSEPVPEPLSFAIDNPARVALDFADVTLNLPSKTQNIGVGMARSVSAVEAGGRTRVVFNLIKLVPYQMRLEGSAVYVTLDSPGAAGATAFRGEAEAAAPAGQRSLTEVDFRRGEQGEGRIIVGLTDPSTVVDTREEGDQIIIDFLATTLPERLQRRLDVIDFATPARTVDTFVNGKDVRMVVTTDGSYDLLAYQSDDLFTIEVKPLTEEEEEALKKEKFGYTGERLSLNFQNIEVRAVLQLIADFTGKNLVASDTVSGNLTLRLKNVPWDQALDIILKSKGLAKREEGNVIMVAPSEEIAAREKLELEALKQITELAPLQTEFIQVNYAKASELATLLKQEENSLLSERGNVSIDERTNTLLVRDTADNLAGVRRLVTQLDIPVRQVLIETRIVIADDDFNRDLGVRFGVSRQTGQIVPNNTVFQVAGARPGGIGLDEDQIVGLDVNGAEGLIVDLPLADPAAALSLAVFHIPDFLLQLELQALQTEGRGEVLANPRVLTSNQKEAVIEQGTEIPFQEASSSGATTTSFKPAVLSLRVTPQITPDDRIIMDLAVNQDTVGQEFAGIPSVDTRAVTTQVLVDNGDTVVLGGIFEQTQRRDIEKVPFFGDLPYLNFLFRQESIRDEKTELLIFVTPKIMKETLSLK
jgi:type IV pilus assembly protein PilQ